MTTRHCVVVGSPISHSRSPVIHRLFAEQFGLALRYEKREVKPGCLDIVLAELRERGCVGVNVTLPLKEEACALATQRAPRVVAAGAANTLWFGAGGELHADNTDGIGLVRDLRANRMEPTGARILLIGAGGAAMGILPALMAESPREVTVMNRGLERAQRLGAAYGLDALPLDAVVERPFDLVINSSALGLGGSAEVTVSPSVLGPATHCYDIVYARGETPFLHWAAAHGVSHRRDGLGMLVEQAAEAFHLWHEQRPRTEAVIEFLRVRR